MRKCSSTQLDSTNVIDPEILFYAPNKDTRNGCHDNSLFSRLCLFACSLLNACIWASLWLFLFHPFPLSLCARSLSLSLTPPLSSLSLSLSSSKELKNKQIMDSISLGNPNVEMALGPLFRAAPLMESPSLLVRFGVILFRTDTCMLKGERERSERERESKFCHICPSHYLELTW
jgi:hypothetical protein